MFKQIQSKNKQKNKNGENIDKCTTLSMVYHKHCPKIHKVKKGKANLCLCCFRNCIIYNNHLVTLFVRVYSIHYLFFFGVWFSFDDS